MLTCSFQSKPVSYSTTGANVVAIYPLQGLATENVPDWLEEFTNDLGYTDGIHPIFDALPALRNLCSGSHWPTPEQFLDALQFGNEKGSFFTEIGNLAST
ncbi:hypothetical protein DEA98_05240 [Brucella pseudogrignonensis]|nr:hypothetical protein [Brucella pseudogrignonensis]